MVNLLLFRIFYSGETGNALKINEELIVPDIICAAPYGEYGYHRAEVKERVEDGMVTVSYNDYCLC